MALSEILSKEEVEDYHQKWAEFKGKLTPETSYAVHSGFPIIGKVF